MRRIALPVEKGKLSQYFERSERFKIINIKDNAIIENNWIEVPSLEPKILSGWLLKNGITDIVVNRIKQKVVQVCNLNKVNVFVGVQNEELNEIVQDFIDGILVTHGDLVEH